MLPSRVTLWLCCLRNDDHRGGSLTPATLFAFATTVWALSVIFHES